MCSESRDGGRLIHYVSRSCNYSLSIETINVTLDPSGVAAPSSISPGTDGTVYDMAGRRVKDFTQPGIYIRNGKKFLRK